MSIAVVPARSGACPRVFVCFSHLRWELVFQRPQHLMCRAAREGKVLFLEEPLFEGSGPPRLATRRHSSGVEIATPILTESCLPGEAAPAIRVMLDAWLAGAQPKELIAWYYTPMALAFSAHLTPDMTVYDCMDELAAFRNPPPGLLRRETELFERADIVFAGGRSLYEAKRRRHPRVFSFPSSVDTAHFARARGLPEPADLMAIRRPRIGFFGVIDERMDLDLVAHAARELPEVEFVMIGPVVKIDSAALPRASNLHWLGPKPYDELPNYLGNWDSGWMPFALNAATRFISPTKTPEFLAAGLPVTSTAVTDVVHDYGQSGLVRIADKENIASMLSASLEPQPADWQPRVNKRLAALSWDRTWTEMRQYLSRTAFGQRQVV